MKKPGLTGAFALKPGFLSGNILLNLDSEDEGELFIGCAGGIDTVINMKYDTEKTPANSFAVKIQVKGLQGGHSGDDINKGRGNAIKILNRFVWDLNAKYGVRVAVLEGGNLRNAIAREAFAVITFDDKYRENVRVDLNVYAAEMENVWKITEPGLQLTLESQEVPAQVLTSESSNALLNALYACPHGVFSMSYRMPGLVETSTNLAAVRFNEPNNILITTSQRSDVNSENSILPIWWNPCSRWRVPRWNMARGIPDGLRTRILPWLRWLLNHTNAYSVKNLSCVLFTPGWNAVCSWKNTRIWIWFLSDPPCEAYIPRMKR